MNVEDFFTFAPNSGTRGNSKKLFVEHMRVECRRNFFSKRVVVIWNNLAESVINAPDVGHFIAAIEKLAFGTYCKVYPF